MEPNPIAAVLTVTAFSEKATEAGEKLAVYRATPLVTRNSSMYPVML
jgi:hypothetical protein